MMVRNCLRFLSTTKIVVLGCPPLSDRQQKGTRPKRSELSAFGHPRLLQSKTRQRPMNGRGPGGPHAQAMAGTGAPKSTALLCLVIMFHSWGSPFSDTPLYIRIYIISNLSLLNLDSC